MTALEIKLAIGAAILAASLIAFGLYHHHVILEGEAKIEASDAKALQAAKAKADAETQLNIERAAAADAGAANAQKAVDDYRAAHPEPDVRVCHAADSGQPGVRPASTANQGPPSGAAGPAAVSEMPRRGDSVEGPNIRPDLDAIVQAAQRLDILYADRQQR